MLITHANPSADKGWYLGPWNSDLPIPVGYAKVGIDDPHVHSRITEIYLVARGTSELRVEQATITLNAGDVIMIEPGEAHTFLSSSPDYFHFVIHVPGLPSEEVHAERSAVPRVRLGL